jgi:hypothetical protein
MAAHVGILTTTAVTDGASVVVAAARLTRKGFLIENAGTQTAYIRLDGGAAAAATRSFALAVGAVYEAYPTGQVYTGAITARFYTAGTGSINVTEFEG